MNGTTVTLTTSGTAYNLFTLVKAIQAGVSPSCCQLTITADSGNGGNVYVGDSTVSTSIFGARLPANGSANFTASFNGIGMEAFYLAGDASSQKVDIIANRI